MPRDILLTVFEEALEAAYRVSRELHNNQAVSNALSNESPIWRLGQVCVHWRKALRSHPLAWSRIRINFGAFSTVRTDAIETRFRELIQHSGTTVLHIELLLVPSCTHDLGDVIAGTLRDVAGRIGLLSVHFTSYKRGGSADRATLPLPLLQSKLLANCVFSALRKLTLTIPNSKVQLGDVDLQVDAFAQCPLLRHLFLCEETHRVKFVLPYQNLITVHANGGPIEDVINQLECPTDVDLELTMPHRKPQTGTIQFPSTWRATALKTLKKVHFRCSFLGPFDVHRPARNNIFRSLHARSLRTLELDTPYPPLVPELLGMIPDVALGGLHELILNCMPTLAPNLRVDGVHRLMARMPALRVLSIGELFGHCVLSALAEDDGLLPALAILKIIPELLLEDCELVVQFARGRQNMLSVEVLVSHSLAYYEDKTKFIPTILGSDTGIFWRELLTVAQVQVV